MYQLLNIFFFIFHTAFTIFNCLGWIWKKTRRWNLYTLLLTAFSWFFLGIWFGWGYCLCTDWHWQVREKLGYRDDTNSYIHFLVYKITGLHVDASAVEQITLVVFVFSFMMSSWLNFRDVRINKLK